MLHNEGQIICNPLEMRSLGVCVGKTKYDRISNGDPKRMQGRSKQFRWLEYVERKDGERSS